MSSAQATMLSATAADALAVIDEAIAEHSPRRAWALFSGGHDSLVSTHIASRHPSFSGVAHIDTGIGVPDTHEYVREVCGRYGWPLRELRPPQGCTFPDIARLFGMPGPMGHRIAYARLKERCVRQLVRESKQGREDRIGLVAGCRRIESRRRTANVDAYRREGARVWINPIHDWTLYDRERYIDEQGLPRSPVVANLHLSGDCLCGSYAHPGEFEEVRFFYPEVAAEIRRCEVIAAAAGKPCVWGRGNNAPRVRMSGTAPGPLCAGCQVMALDETAPEGGSAR